MTPTPTMDAEEFRAWNESMSQKYHPDDYHASSSGIVRWIERKRVEMILRFLQVQEYHRVLEVGVGCGTILRQIRSQNRVGVDLSKHYLAIAKERLSPDVRLIEGDAEELLKVVEPRSFDRIYCSEVLEHVRHPGLALSQMASALKEDGIVVVSVPHEKLIDACKAMLHRTRLFKKLFPGLAGCEEGNEWHLHSFSRSDMQKLFEEAGLDIIALRGVPYGVLPLRFVVSGKVKKRA